MDFAINVKRIWLVANEKHIAPLMSSDGIFRKNVARRKLSEGCVIRRTCIGKTLSEYVFWKSAIK
jgi:hypothetical protein